MKVYKNTEYPKKDDAVEGFSVDVISCNEIGEIAIIFYSFCDKEWWQMDGHKDVTYDEDGNLRDFVWMYKPEELKV